MTVAFRDVKGRRGENAVVDCLTDYSAFSKALFWPAILDGKWPRIDFYVELLDVPQRTPFFFVQAKATTVALSAKSRTVRISTKKQDIEGLLQFPGPTYIFGVHLPSKKVFVRSVHIGTPARAITRIPLTNELTAANLKLLYDEVEAFWRTGPQKPGSSVFA